MNIIYIRTSSKEQNPENQLKDCISINKFGEYELFEDKQSAWNDNKEREKFEIISKSIQNKKVNYLIVWDLDRIYRNRAKLLGFMEMCKANNCQVYSYRQKFLNEIQEITLPKGFEFIKDMMINNFLQFLGWIAEDESTKKSERVKIAVRRKDGDITKSYKGNKWGRKSIPKSTIEMVLELNRKGYNIRKIANEVKYWDSSKHQKNISKSAVHKILVENKGLNSRKGDVH